MTNQPVALPKNGRHTEVGRPEVTHGVWYTPRVDILETDEELTLFADLPGTKAADVDVRFENGELRLQAQCPARQQETSYLLSEYGVGDFYRAFSINQDINPDKIVAELKNGVLTLHLLKSEAVKPRKIAIKGE